MNDMYEEEFEETIHISDYLDILYKRKATVILVFMLVVSLAILLTYRAIPVYQANATLIIDKEKSSSPITGQRMDYESYASQTLTFNTHFKLILSKEVIQRVIDALKLGESSAEDREISTLINTIAAAKKNLKLLLNIEDPPPLSPQEETNNLLESVKKKISVNQVEDTRLLKVAVKDKDPELAARIANTLARQYIEFNLANRMDSSKNTLDWMNGELYHLKKKLEDDEKAFFDFKQNKKVFSLAGQQKMADQKLSEFNSNYLSTRNTRLELDAKLSEIEKNFEESRDLGKVRSLINNDVLEAVYAKVKDLEIQQANLAKVYKSKHPKMIQVQGALAKNRARLEEELGKELNSLKSKRSVFFSREIVLKDTLKEFEQDALDTSGNELEYSILQRNLNTSQALYDTLLAKIKESNLLKSSDTSQIRMVEIAAASNKPVSPNKKRNILLGIILGLFTGVGAAFFLEYMDQTIRTEEDVHNYLNLPVLSVVPIADGDSQNK